MAQRECLRIQLLSVPNAHWLNRHGTHSRTVWPKTHVDVFIEGLVGNYSFPTILSDGFDVTGRPREQENQASCRLDLPTQVQILVALRGFSVLTPEGPCTGRLQASAFGE